MPTTHSTSETKPCIVSPLECENIPSRPLCLGPQAINKRPWCSHSVLLCCHDRTPASMFCLSPSDELLTRSPRVFRTFGLREKCMWRVPSAPTLTATFFSVLLPQCGQKTLVTSDVVLENHRRVQCSSVTGWLQHSPQAGF